MSGRDTLAGICGINYNLIANCYTLGKINAQEGAQYTGEFVIYSEGTIDNCFFYNKDSKDDNYAQNISDDYVKDGSLAYLLRIGEKVSGECWGQNLGTDTVPNFTGAQVYAMEGIDLARNKYHDVILNADSFVDLGINKIAIDLEKKVQGRNIFTPKEGTTYHAAMLHVSDDMKNIDFNLTFEIDTFVYDRTINSDVVSFALPTALPTEKVNGVIYSLKEFDGTNLNFEEVTDENLEAGHPYVVKGKIGNRLLDTLYNVILESNPENSYRLDDELIMNNVVSQMVSHIGLLKEEVLFNTPTPPYTYYAYEGGTLYQVDTVVVRPFHAAFAMMTPAQKPAPRALGMTFNGQLTGVALIGNGDIVSGKVNVYDINGRIVRENTESDNCFEGLPSGVYIVNGQKFIIKEK